MTGVYQHTIDSKGRLFVPAKIREILGSAFYVTISAETCLTAYSLESWQVFKDRFDALPYTQAREIRPLFAQAARCELDSQGRILLPQKLRDFAKLGKSVAVVGISKRAEIWDADLWQQQEERENDPVNIQAAMERMGF